MRHLILGARIVALSATAYGFTTGSAPAGNAKDVAARALKEEEHPYPKVTSATRRQDGSIKALCSNSEDYWIFALDCKTIR